MGISGTGTKHHCVGAKHSIGDISAGGCRQVTTVTDAGHKITYCDKHEMPCRGGCGRWQHLKNQSGCGRCMGRVKAEARRERATAEQKKKDVQKEEDEKFWAPGKERKKNRES